MSFASFRAKKPAALAHLRMGVPLNEVVRTAASEHSMPEDSVRMYLRYWQFLDIAARRRSDHNPAPARQVGDTIHQFMERLTRSGQLQLSMPVGVRWPGLPEQDERRRMYEVQSPPTEAWEAWLDEPINWREESP